MPQATTNKSEQTTFSGSITQMFFLPKQGGKPGGNSRTTNVHVPLVMKESSKIY